LTDSDINDSFMFDSNDEFFVFSESNNIDLDKISKIFKINISCNNSTSNVNENCNNNKNNFNKDESYENYITKKCSSKNLCYICKCLNINNFENTLNQKVIGVPPIYKEYIEVFNESNCDILPPNREYDCEIRL